MDSPLRLAMWSGPRNISTAMMRSWGSREDTVVCDEPLYAHYLKVTGLPHPAAREVTEHHETDWRKVSGWLTGEVPSGKTIFYQKHMAHHLLPEVERDWLGELTHAFLIRDPAEMLLSLSKVTPSPRLEDTGLPQQAELVDRIIQEKGKAPPVLDARDVLGDPPHFLDLLCREVGVEFDEAMLSWDPGRRDTDGVWASHWYGAVEASTGWHPYEEKEVVLPESLRSLHEACTPFFNRLYGLRLGA